VKEVSNAWPALPFAEWAGYRDDAPHVDADRGKNSPGADSVDEPLMARDVLRNFARPNDPLRSRTAYARSKSTSISSITKSASTRAMASDERFELKPRSVADFYRTVMKTLDELHLPG